MEIYVVRPGDTIDSIALMLGVSVEQLIYDNQLIYPYELAVGQALFVDRNTRNAARAISVSGYAYPFISPWVLEQTLPFLSELPIFSYGFTAEGELLPPTYGDDTWMIAEGIRIKKGKSERNKKRFPIPYTLRKHFFCNLIALFSAELLKIIQ